jgi:hypothetical protein
MVEPSTSGSDGRSAFSSLVEKDLPAKSENFQCAGLRALLEAARADSDSDDWCPRPRRPRDRERLELEQLGYLPADASEEYRDDRTGQDR